MRARPRPDRSCRRAARVTTARLASRSCVRSVNTSSSDEQQDHDERAQDREAGAAPVEHEVTRAGSDRGRDRGEQGAAQRARAAGPRAFGRARGAAWARVAVVVLVAARAGPRRAGVVTGEVGELDGRGGALDHPVGAGLRGRARVTGGGWFVVAGDGRGDRARRAAAGPLHGGAGAGAGGSVGPRDVGPGALAARRRGEGAATGRVATGSAHGRGTAGGFRWAGGCQGRAGRPAVGGADRAGGLVDGATTPRRLAGHGGRRRSGGAGGQAAVGAVGLTGPAGVTPPRGLPSVVHHSPPVFPRAAGRSGPGCRGTSCPGTGTSRRDSTVRPFGRAYCE